MTYLIYASEAEVPLRLNKMRLWRECKSLEAAMNWICFYRFSLNLRVSIADSETRQVLVRRGVEGYPDLDLSEREIAERLDRERDRAETSAEQGGALSTCNDSADESRRSVSF